MIAGRVRYPRKDREGKRLEWREGEAIKKAGIGKCGRVVNDDVEEVERSRSGEGVEGVVVI